MSDLSDSLEAIREEMIDKLNKMEKLMKKSPSEFHANQHWFASAREALGAAPPKQFVINAVDTISMIRQEEKLTERDQVELTSLPTFFQSDSEKEELNELLYTTFIVVAVDDEHVDIQSIETDKIYHRIPDWAVDIL